MYTLIEERTGIRIKEIGFGPANIPQAQDIITIGDSQYRVLRKHLVCTDTGLLTEKHLIVEKT